jgi:dynein heavy chain
VEDAADKFFVEHRRKTYVTPKSYLDGIQLYLKYIQTTRQKHSVKENKLKTGIRNLNETNDQIAELKLTLQKLQPSLVIQNEQAER